MNCTLYIYRLKLRYCTHNFIVNVTDVEHELEHTHEETSIEKELPPSGEQLKGKLGAAATF